MKVLIVETRIDNAFELGKGAIPAKLGDILPAGYETGARIQVQDNGKWVTIAACMDCPNPIEHTLTVLRSQPEYKHAQLWVRDMFGERHYLGLKGYRDALMKRGV